MQRHISTLLIALAGAALVQVGTARADTDVDAFDSTGWTKLGEQTVDGTHDEDTIEVGRAEGRFSRLMVVVLEDDLVLSDVTVTFGNGDTFSPELPFRFEKGTRSRPIDLPGRARGIASITLIYGDLDDSGHRGRRHQQHVREHTRPVVQIWGLEADRSEEGWDLLGSLKVTKSRGVLTLRAPKDVEHYDRLRVAVSRGNLRITSVVVKYEKGKRGRHRVDHAFDDTSRNQLIELDAKDRAIRSVTISYVRSGNRRAAAMIEVWGLRREADTFDSTGWTMLGEQTVDRRRDHDAVAIGRDQGRFEELAFVMSGGRVDMTRIVVRPVRGDDFEPDLATLFPDGQRWGTVDLPGKRTAIDEIDFEYGAHRGDGQATVQIWAR